MIYKCDVCNLEYKEKPDYCECGNDTFHAVSQDTPDVQKSGMKKLPLKHILSIVIFKIILLISILIWIEKPVKKEASTVPVKQQTAVEIPDIEKIWDSTPPKNIQPQTQNVITVYEPLKTKKQKVEKPQAVRPAPTPVKRTKTTPRPKPSTQPVELQNKPAQPQQTSQKSQTPPKSVKMTPQPQQTNETPKPQQTMNLQEWNSYKNSLRYTLLSKLNVVNISGEGDCAIEFSFDNTGKLLNRKFIYKSQNKTVNDEIYLMLMKLPTFKTPPTGYNGEKVKMKFYFNNGQYEISFIN